LCALRPLQPICRRHHGAEESRLSRPIQACERHSCAVVR